MQELSKEDFKFYITYKTKAIADVLNYYEEELEKQDIKKNIIELYEQQKIPEQTKVELLQAVERYKIYIIDLLAGCKELHIKLVDSKMKWYKNARGYFYRGVAKEE